MAGARLLGGAVAVAVPGDVQTVPRAIKTLVCGCYWGLLAVVSDRVINVDMYNDPDKNPHD